MKILVYVRTWNKDFFGKMAKDAFENAEITYFSDFRKRGDIWSGEYIYNSKYDMDNLEYDEIKNDIILRCRFLRSLPLQKAEALSRRFWNGFEELMKKEKYDVLITAAIDCYTMDIMERIVTKYNCGYYSIIPSFIKGYGRFTRRGELFDANRLVDDAEVNSVVEMLTKDDYKVAFALNKEKSEWEVRKFYYRRKLTNILFGIKKHLERDKWNYHYNTLSFTGGNYSLYSPKEAKKYYKRISEISFGVKCVYMPLHYAPEATVDYWCDNPECAKYEASVIDFIRNSSSNIQFVLKEHPAMYGKRHVEFYRDLMNLGNVVIVHPYENSNQLLRSIENVLVYTGSVGVESLLRNKRVFTVAKNYYYGIHENIHFVDKLKDVDLEIQIKNVDNKEFVRTLLAGMYKGYTVLGRDIEKSDLNSIVGELKRIHESKIK